MLVIGAFVASPHVKDLPPIALAGLGLLTVGWMAKGYVHGLHWKDKVNGR